MAPGSGGGGAGGGGRVRGSGGGRVRGGGRQARGTAGPGCGGAGTWRTWRGRGGGGGGGAVARGRGRHRQVAMAQVAGGGTGGPGDAFNQTGPARTALPVGVCSSSALRQRRWRGERRRACGRPGGRAAGWLCLRPSRASVTRRHHPPPRPASSVTERRPSCVRRATNSAARAHGAPSPEAACPRPARASSTQRPVSEHSHLGMWIAPRLRPAPTSPAASPHCWRPPAPRRSIVFERYLAHPTPNRVPAPSQHAARSTQHQHTACGAYHATPLPVAPFLRCHADCNVQHAPD